MDVTGKNWTDGLYQFRKCCCMFAGPIPDTRDCITKAGILLASGAFQYSRIICDSGII